MLPAVSTTGSAARVERVRPRTNSTGCCTSLTFNVYDAAGVSIADLVDANSSNQIFEADFGFSRGHTFEVYATCPIGMDCSGGASMHHT